MTLLKLTRKYDNTVWGIEYTGENMPEVIQYYATASMSVSIVPESMELVFRERGETESLRIGDWIITEHGSTGIVPKGMFERRYAVVADVEPQVGMYAT